MNAKSKVLVISLLALALCVAVVSQVRAQEGAEGDVEDGRQLFAEYCAVCHGYDGRGRIGAPLTGWFASIDPSAFVRSTVSNGVADTMPAFAQSQGGPLTEEQIDDIAAFILTWRERVEPAPTPTPVPVTPIPTIAGVSGDPTMGAQVYARECEVCHGPQGQGGIGATLSGPIAASQPAAFLRETIRQGVPGSPMPAWQGVLSDDEIEGTVAYILSWERRPVSAPEEELGEEGSISLLVAVGFLIVLLLLAVAAVTWYSGRRRRETRE